MSAADHTTLGRTSTAMTVRFDEATKVQQIDSHTYSGDFPDEWCIGTGEYDEIVLNIAG